MNKNLREWYNEDVSAYLWVVEGIMKKIGVILLVIIGLVVLGVRVVDEVRHEQPKLSPLLLEVKAKIYAGSSGDGEFDTYVSEFELSGSSELQIENIISTIRKKNEGYELAYSGQLKGFGKTIVTKGIYFFGFFFGQRQVHSLYVYEPIYGTIDFREPDRLFNNGLPEPTWYIEEARTIDLSKFKQ